MLARDKPFENAVPHADLGEMVLAPDAQLTEAELVESAKRLDVSAWSTIYRRHYRQVYGYIYFRTGDRELAADLTAEVFVRALNGIRAYQYRGTPLLAWLYRVAHNVTADYRKKAARRGAREMPALDEDREDPSDAIERTTDKTDMMAAIRQLTGEQQQVVLLRFYHEMSTADVAAALGKPEGAVKALQNRALKSLRRLLSGPRDARAG